MRTDAGVQLTEGPLSQKIYCQAFRYGIQPDLIVPLTSHIDESA